VIQKCKQQIEGMESDIQSISSSERHDRRLRLAELEANRAQNMMTHEKSILSRPPKTWFQSEKEKMASKLLSASIWTGEEIGTGLNMPLADPTKQEPNQDPQMAGLNKQQRKRKRKQLAVQELAEEKKKELEEVRFKEMRHIKAVTKQIKQSQRKKPTVDDRPVYESVKQLNKKHKDVEKAASDAATRKMRQREEKNKANRASDDRSSAFSDDEEEEQRVEKRYRDKKFTKEEEKKESSKSLFRKHGHKAFKSKAKFKRRNK